MSKTLFIIFIFIIAHSIINSQQNPHSIIELKNSIKVFNSDESEPKVFLSIDQNSNKKKTGLAILYSLLLPGMGELYAEGYDSGIYFTITDGILWTAVLGMNIYGNWLEKSYKSFAQVNANINLDGKDKDFFALISAYSSIDDYNNEKAFERNFNAMLDKQKFYWNWNSIENRKTYRRMWTSSESAFNNIRFAVGGLILNRLVSVINAVRLTSKHNRKIDNHNFSINVLIQKNINYEDEIILNFKQKF